jgi:hypothetical protein
VTEADFNRLSYDQIGRLITRLRRQRRMVRSPERRSEIEAELERVLAWGRKRLGMDPSWQYESVHVDLGEACFGLSAAP